MILFSSEKNISVKRWQKLRKKILRRILLIGLLDQASTHSKKLLEVIIMKWETPSYTDLRFGFEVTMYIYNR